MPALATTTASIAGLQTIELIKVLKNEKVEHIKSAYLNLGVPILQLSEPGPAAKSKIHDDLSVTIWDRWDVKNGAKMKLQDLFKHLESTYRVVVSDVFYASKCIYSKIIMANNPTQREKTLGENFLKVLENLEIVKIY